MRAPDAVADAELLKPWQVAREQYKNKKRAIGDRQKDTLARLAAFQGKLRGPEAGGGGGGGGAAAGKGTASGGEAEGGGGGGGRGGPEAGAHYDGRVSGAIDHNAYMPAAWRVDDYGSDGEEGGGGGGGAGLDLASLRQHRLDFAKGSAAGEIGLGGDGRWAARALGGAGRDAARRGELFACACVRACVCARGLQVGAAPLRYGRPSWDSKQRRADTEPNRKSNFETPQGPG
jgi:hypothetical protein